MRKEFRTLRSMAAIAVVLGLAFNFTGCKPDDETTPDPETPVSAIYLTSPITENTTLKDLGLDIDYIWDGTALVVENNAVLTIEPGVTIQFTKDKFGGIEINYGATIKAIGTAEKHIQFLGVGTHKGSWGLIDIHTATDNKFEYCDFINGGGAGGQAACVIRCWTEATQIGISHCKISGSPYQGLVMYENNRVTAFDNNVIENCDDVPVWIRGELKMLEKFDMTSDFTNNTKQYIHVSQSSDHTEDATINRTSVPYYFHSSCELLNALLAINEGVTIYMGDNVGILKWSATGSGRLVINGTPENKVKFTRLPGTTQYWSTICFKGLIGSEIKNCIFEYGGKRDGAAGMIELFDNADLTLTNVEFNNSYNYGVILGTGGCNFRLVHNNVTFADNYLGNVYNKCNDPATVDENLP